MSATSSREISSSNRNWPSARTLKRLSRRWWTVIEGQACQSDLAETGAQGTSDQTVNPNAKATARVTLEHKRQVERLEIGALSQPPPRYDLAWRTEFCVAKRFSNTLFRNRGLVLRGREEFQADSPTREPRAKPTLGIGFSGRCAMSGSDMTFAVLVTEPNATRLLQRVLPHRCERAYSLRPIIRRPNVAAQLATFRLRPIHRRPTPKPQTLSCMRTDNPALFRVGR